MDQSSNGALVTDVDVSNSRDCRGMQTRELYHEVILKCCD